MRKYQNEKTNADTLKSYDSGFILSPRPSQIMCIESKYFLKAGIPLGKLDDLFSYSVTSYVLGLRGPNAVLNCPPPPVLVHQAWAILS